MTEYDELDLVVLKQVIPVLTSLIDLFTGCGEQVKSAWLADRLSSLMDAGTTDETKSIVIGELHEIVLGMGGLMDLYLKRQGEEDTPAISEDLEQLADQLFELTRR